MKIMKTFFIILLLSKAANSFTLNGSQVGWENKNLAINVNPTNCPSDIFDRLDDSIRLWNSVATSSLKLSIGNTASTTTGAQLAAGTATDSPVVVCDAQFTTTFNQDQSIAGVGYGSPITNGGPLAYGYLALNVQSGTSANVLLANATIKGVVIAHEIGHMLGFGHSSSQTALMYYSAGSQENLTLSKDDWDGLSYLYPRDELSQTNLAAGCGLVQNQKLDPTKALLSFFILMLPLFFWLRLRSRAKNYILT